MCSELGVNFCACDVSVKNAVQRPLSFSDGMRSHVRKSPYLLSGAWLQLPYFFVVHLMSASVIYCVKSSKAYDSLFIESFHCKGSFQKIR